MADGKGTDSGSQRVEPGGSEKTSTRPGGQGSGPTQVGAAGTGLDGPVAGATGLLALYGFIVILWDLIAGKKLLPDSGFGVAGCIVGCLVVGAVIGGGIAARGSR